MNKKREGKWNKIEKTLCLDITNPFALADMIRLKGQTFNSFELNFNEDKTYFDSKFQDVKGIRLTTYRKDTFDSVRRYLNLKSTTDPTSPKIPFSLKIEEIKKEFNVDTTKNYFTIVIKIIGKRDYNRKIEMNTCSRTFILFGIKDIQLVRKEFDFDSVL
jgi:hypothetical protein